MSNYVESKKELDKIASKYGCKGDIIMRTAVQYIVEYGQYMFNDQDFIDDQIQQINDKHKDAEAEGKHLWITKDFELAILNCARELAEVNSYDLIIYMQKEMFWSEHEGGLDYKNMKHRLIECMSWMEQQEDDNRIMYDIFNECSLSDNELELLGFEYLIPEEEEE